MAYFFFKLVPPRSSFPEDMTEAERELMERHAAYWRSLLDKRLVLVFGGLMGLNPVKYWPHWSAILKEKESGQKYAVDRWPFDQGENAAVVKVQDWYIKDDE
jgi:hypothetical protein